MNVIELMAKEKNKEKKKKYQKEIDNIQLKHWNKVRDCDVIITSSSRPELLELTLKYFEIYIHFYGNFRFILNEDFVLKDESKKLIEWAKNSCYFKDEDIYSNDPPLGLDKSLISLIEKVNTPFCLYLQDDWVFERPIELDKAMYIMEHLNNVNNILFYKSTIPEMKDGVRHREYYFTQFPQHLTLSYSWELMPGLWRTEFIKEKIYEAMKDKKRRTAPAKITHCLRPSEKRDDPDYLYDNMGVFYWGSWGEPRYCRHIGENARMESWRMTEDGKPGKENTTQENNAINNMARWIPFEHIPLIEGRNSVKIMKEAMLKRKKRNEKKNGL